MVADRIVAGEKIGDRDLGRGEISHDLGLHAAPGPGSCPLI